MARLHIPGFAGERPAITPRRLPEEAATIAKNCLLEDGDLTPLHGTLLVEEQPLLPSVNAKTIHLYENQHWFAFSDDVDVVSSPIVQDPWARVYYTGSGKPKVTRNDLAIGSGVMPSISYQLGVPAPVARPTVFTEISEEDPEGIDDDETRFYVYTYVTESGEESAPSPLSSPVLVTTPLDRITVYLSQPGNNIYNISHMYVYRSASSAQDAVFLRVAKLHISHTQFIDNKKDSELGALLETLDYIPPPTDLQGLVALGNGMLAGFTGSTVCVSEAFLPYAWPTRYQHKSEWQVVGMASINGAVVVCTEGEPYMLAGTSPDAMMMESLSTQQACVSKRSIVAMDGFVLYASPDGMVMVSGSGASLISDTLIKPKQWRELNPETIHAYYHEGEYIAFYGDVAGNGEGRGGFILNPSRRDIRFFDMYATAAHRDLKTDKFYVLMSGQLKRWSEGEVLKAVWRSKLFETPTMNFALCQVIATDINGIVIRIFADGELLHKHTLTTEHKGVFWLPAGLFSSWQIELETTKPVHSVTLATHHHELD
ncbi:hypothetical protein [Pseudoalteromonas galatheae]|uniref:hypothetical protein n=1 Tax=Pseudoalteromonas galatheae TaxID=579562 RepID=UPI0030D5AD41